MVSVFISHVEEDQALALEIARGLETAGFTTWYYERDSEPGISYLLQVHAALAQCDAVVVLISPDSVRSYQMTKEVVRAHETGKAFIPVRYNISHAEFQQRQPEWNIAIGAAASIPVALDGVPAIIPRIARGLQQLSPPRDERIPRSSEAIPATESAPKGRAEPQPSEAETTVRYAADPISKAHTDLQRPAESPGRSGVVDSRAGQGAIRRGDKSVYVAVAFFGSLVVIGGATYLFRGDAPVQPVPSEVSQSGATPTEVARPYPAAVASPKSDSSAHSSGGLVANIPQPLVNAPLSRSGESQPPRLFGRSSTSPALRLDTPGKEPGPNASKPGETVNVEAERREFEKKKQFQMELALRNIDDSCRLWEEAALEKPEGEDPAVLQQMKEKRGRVEETKQRLKATSDLEKRAQILRELDNRLADLDKIVRQLKAAPRYIKAG